LFFKHGSLQIHGGEHSCLWVVTCAAKLYQEADIFRHPGHSHFVPRLLFTFFFRMLAFDEDEDDDDDNGDSSVEVEVRLRLGLRLRVRVRNI
jgi:hypothetical protein